MITEFENQCAELKDQGYSYAQIATMLTEEGRETTKNGVGKAVRRFQKKKDLDENPGINNALMNMQVQPGMVSSGWLKSKEASIHFKMPKSLEDEEKIEDIIRGAFEKDIPRVDLIDSPDYTDDDLLCKYVIADLHLGMYAWAKECGESYNLDETSKVLRSSMEHLISQAPPAKRGLILNLGDFYHANDQRGVTPISGHFLDMSGRFAEIAIEGVRHIRYCIERALEKHEIVEYVGIPGNHDRDQNHWLTISIAEAYRDNPRVKVHFTGSHWFHTTHGQNLLAAHHGDSVNFTRLVLAMGSNMREVWTQTYWKFLDTGHVHHQREQEIGDVLCRSYRALTAKDAHAASHAYVSKRGMSVQTYHKRRGEVSNINANLYMGELPI